MKEVKHVKAEDAVEIPAGKAGAEAPDLGPLLGEWVNTNEASKGVNRVALSLNGEHLTVRLFGSVDGTERDWEAVEADCVYAAGISSKQPVAFSATYNFDSRQARVLTNQSLGLLIVAICTTVDGAASPASFTREFYRRVTPR